MTPGQPPGPDPFDADLSAVHDAVDNLGPWVAIWQARREPDAFARRCASDAIDAAYKALAAIHRIRARLITETRQADDQAATRADQLLAKMRDGPPGHAQEDHRTARPQRRRDAEAICVQGNAGGDGGRAPREEAVNPLQLARDRFERDLRQVIRSDAGPGSSVAWSYLHLIELASEFPGLPARALVQRAIAWYGYVEAGRLAEGEDGP